MLPPILNIFPMLRALKGTWVLELGDGDGRETEIYEELSMMKRSDDGLGCSRASGAVSQACVVHTRRCLHVF